LAVIVGQQFNVKARVESKIDEGSEKKIMHFMMKRGNDQQIYV